jgi:hypothetical protein
MTLKRSLESNSLLTFNYSDELYGLEVDVILFETSEYWNKTAYGNWMFPKSSDWDDFWFNEKSSTMLLRGVKRKIGSTNYDLIHIKASL